MQIEVYIKTLRLLLFPLGDQMQKFVSYHLVSLFTSLVLPYFDALSSLRIRSQARQLSEERDCLVMDRGLSTTKGDVIAFRVPQLHPQTVPQLCQTTLFPLRVFVRPGEELLPGIVDQLRDVDVPRR